MWQHTLNYVLTDNANRKTERKNDTSHPERLFTSGVSNTRPARCLCAARDIIKLTQIIVWTAETFFLLLRPASLFLLKCGPRMKLSLRPLVYIIDFDIHSPTYLHFSRERDEKFFKANGVWQTPSYSFVKKHIKALFTRDIFAHNIEIKRY